jgi:Membrane protein implicated in regulation of membrane protease activity
MFGFDFSFWTWGIIAGCLLILELIVPMTFFLWPGIAAVLVGIIAYFAPNMALEWQFLLFAVLGLGSALFWHYRMRRFVAPTSLPSLNHRGVTTIGRTITLTKPIQDGFGIEKLDGVYWKIQGPDLPKGSKVIVTALQDGVLAVEAIQPD